MNKNYTAVVMSRFMTEEQLKTFDQEYKENKLTLGAGARVVSDRDLMILIDYKKGALVGELEKKYGTGRTSIMTSLRIAALSKI